MIKTTKSEGEVAELGKDGRDDLLQNLERYFTSALDTCCSQKTIRKADLAHSAPICYKPVKKSFTSSTVMSPVVSCTLSML